ncbi:uncharacterized protein L203_102295 [Cryptococcus depauperatus CBS 7841]|uniref:Uncharacterized protein n=1 Tax=Cryptococcus depauperatus CBS 7841 TaxID=1295531 RepID=A0AAJ8JRI9_9TREE
MNLSRIYNGELQRSTTWQQQQEPQSGPGSDTSQQGSACSPSVEPPNPPDQPGSSSFKSEREWPSGTGTYRAGVHLGYAVEDLDDMTKTSHLIPNEKVTEIRNSMSGLSTTLKEKNATDVDVAATIKETKRLGNQLYYYQDKPECSDIERRGINHVTESLYHAREALSEWESTPSESANSIAPSALNDADG